jgi:hypothetical protein
MKTIEIKATQFFELLKMKDCSMWEIFTQMIDGTEKEIIFLNEEDQILFTYILPLNVDLMNKDRIQFSKEYADKLSGLN